MTTKGIRDTALANLTEPLPLLFSEAFAHLRRGRLLRSTMRPVPLGLAVVLLAGGGYFAPSMAVSIAAGIIGAVVSLGAGYAIWYSWFTARNIRHQTLCPACTSRMWQVCCGHCGKPVPPLALMLGGVFLSSCPHCGVHVSGHRGGLLAWCANCGHTRLDPGRFYRKQTKVTVWIDDELPPPACLKYEEISRGPSHLTLFDGNSASLNHLLFFRTDYRTSTSPVDPHLIERARVLFLSEGIRPVWVSRITGFFGPGTLRQILPPVRDLCAVAHCGPPVGSGFGQKFEFPQGG